MNTETNNQSVTTNIFDEERAFRAYRPRLTFYHANGKGSGSAARLEVVPASSDREGVIYLTLAPQKSIASGKDEEGNRQYATFDWQNRLTVKLNFSDLCQMLLVFRGDAAALADGKGLYHDSRSSTTIINLARQAEPYAGLALEVSRRDKKDSSSAARVRIVFKDAEASGLGAVIEQSLGVIAFGIPKEFRQFSDAVRPDAEPPAV